LFLSIMTAKYTIPSFVSAAAASLIRSILVPRVDQRATLKDIRQHEWMKGPAGDLPLLEFRGASLTKDVPLVKPATAARLLQLGFAPSDIQEYQDQGLPGPVKASVYLLEETLVPRLETASPQLAVPDGPKKRSSLPSSAGTLFYSPTSPTPDTGSSPLATLKRNRTSIAPQIRETEADNIPSSSPMSVAFEPQTPARPPVMATFLHGTSRPKTHMILLESLLARGAKVVEFDDALDQENTMQFLVPMEIKELPDNLFQPPDGAMDVDEEIQACLWGTRTEWVTVRITTIQFSRADTRPIRYHTIFQLPSPCSEEVVAQFDDFCVSMM
ncbi:hypothetical protein HDU91_004575, partial [Kappamyces sp. JEL0680]